LLIIPVVIVHRVDVARRRRKLNSRTANEAFVGSWL